MCVTDEEERVRESTRASVCVCVHACVRARVCVCVCVRERERERERVRERRMGGEKELYARARVYEKRLYVRVIARMSERVYGAYLFGRKKERKREPSLSR